MTSKGPCRVIAALLLFIGAALGIAGAQPAGPAPAPAALEKEARQIERLLIAPCCWMQPVADHQSQASEEVKQQVRTWLGAGMTRQLVLDAFVERYGTRILAEPPNRGFARWLYLGPVAVFGISAVGLFAWVRRMTASRPGAGSQATDEVPDGATPSRPGAAPRSDYEERLDDALRDMD